MKLGKTYDYRNKEEAKELIGKKVAASDYLCNIEGLDSVHNPETLMEVRGCNEYPFDVRDSSGELYSYQFIREVIEDEPKLMTNRQLAEWLAKGNGQIIRVDEKKQIDPLEFVFTHYNFREKEGNYLVDQDIRIRSWDSNEWVMPTVVIYGRDCKGVLRIE